MYFKDYWLLFLFAAIVFALLPTVALASTGQAGRSYTFKTLNDNAQLVGFYVDSAGNTDGFLAS